MLPVPRLALLSAIPSIMLVVGCGNAAMDHAVPLHQLDRSGPPPQALFLSGPDEVRLRLGETLAISIDGDRTIAAALRFSLKDGRLAISRESTEQVPGTAIINIIMPAPQSLQSSGSGSIRAEGLASKARVTVSGSGNVETMNVAAASLDVSITGSGSFRAAGTAERLDLVISGGGAAETDALKVQAARVLIAGNGRGNFASDGKVDARITGSGSVHVRGRARCQSRSTGTGQVFCAP